MKHISLLDQDVDPFNERLAYELDLEVVVLGGRFRFASNAQALLELVRHAYADLPQHRLETAPAPAAFVANADRAQAYPCAAARAPDFRVRLRLVTPSTQIQEPSPLQLYSGGGMLCGVMDAHNFAVMSPAERSALVCISDGLLEHPYYARYELIEFAVYTLAARSQSLVAMHAACVGRAGKGVLIIGETGAGKSTLALQCLHEGMQLLSEDSVFVVPRSLLATGVGTFLHLRADDPLRVDDPLFARLRGNAATIRRRSGVVKHALDLRQAPRLIAQQPFRIVAIAFLSHAPAAGSAVLAPLPPTAVRERLRATQAYAAAQPGWTEFLERAVALPAFELRRACHPEIAARQVRQWLETPAA